MESLPLGGIRVLELGHIVAGPFGGMILADLGAEVIKIENPAGGDSTRNPRSRGLFYSLNRNKKSITLDLKDAKDKERFFSLVARSDVLLENLGPGIVEKLKVDYESVCRVNPRIVYCSIKGFLPGLYAHRPLVDEMAQMMGGLAYMTGPPGNPIRVGTSIVDMGAATFGVVGILAALLQREQTGRGQYIVSGMFETVALWMGRYMAEYQLSGETPVPFPSQGMALRMRWEVYDRFKTADSREIIIACTSDKHWNAFCVALGLNEWRADPKLADKEKRLEARSWLLPAIQEVVGRHQSRELLELLDKNGVPVAPVNTPADLVGDQHLSGSGQLLELDLGDRRLVLPSLPVRRLGSESIKVCQVPKLGEHNDEVLKGLEGAGS